MPRVTTPDGHVQEVDQGRAAVIVHVTATEPPNIHKGMWWLDTSIPGAAVLKVHNGTDWEEVPIAAFGFFNGTFVESFDALVTSDGATVTMSLEQAGGGDLTMRFSDGQTLLDCTPALTIALTAGTDTNPTGNFIYIPRSTKVLTKSTTGWPTAEHIKVVYFLVPTASLVNTGAPGNDEVYVNHNWNDPSAATAGAGIGQGHLSHITERQRRMGARWHSGCEGVATQDGNDLWVSIATGVVYQLHQHTFPALDSDTGGAGDIILVINDPDAAFTRINSLNSITKLSTGVAISNNKYVKLVLWGVANKGGAVSHMAINLPSGEYNTAAAAILDVEGHANFNIPTEFGNESSTGFLIASFVCQHTVIAMVLDSTVDLRGQNPLNVTGSGPGGGDVTAAAALTDEKVVRGDGGAKGVQSSAMAIDDSGNVSGVVTLNGRAPTALFDVVGPKVKDYTATIDELVMCDPS